MLLHTGLSYAPLLALLLWATVTDVRARRIPNWVSATLLHTGLAQAYLLKTGLTPAQSFAGLLAGFSLPFVMFAVRALGAGDVKLLAGVGAWVGPWPVLAVMAATAVIGAALIAAQALWQRRLLQLLHNCGLIVLNLLYVRRLGAAHVVTTGQSVRTLDNTLPYALPISIATALVLFAPAIQGRFS